MQDEFCEKLPDVELDASFEDLLIDDSLPYPERVLKYIHSDHSLQRVKHVKLIAYSIENLPFSRIETLLDEVLPCICKDKETLIRLTLTQELREIIKIISAHNKEGIDYIENKIIPILKDLLRDNEISIREEASNTFCYCASILPCSETSTHILPILIELTHDDEGEEMRSQIIACPLLNKISNYVGPDYTIEFLVPGLICLSENSHFQVRKSAALSYNEICNITFPDIVLYKLLPSFRRLCKDEVWSVRKACCDSLIKLSKVIPVDLRLYYLCDIAIEFSKDCSKWVKSSYYKNLGEFISNLPGNKIPNALLEHYYSFSKPNLLFVNDIIISCAESFVNVLNTLGKSKWNELKPVLQFLVRNPNVLVRKAIASNLHYIGKLISPEYSLELNSYLELFLNDSMDVKQEVVKHIASYIYYLPVENRVKYIDTPKSIISTPSLNWRFRQCIASQFKEFISYLPFQTIAEVFLPLCITLLSDIVSNVRTAILSSIGELLLILNDKEKNNGNETPLNDFIKQLVKFSTMNTYLKRQTYIEICNSIIPVIDSNLFNKYFLNSLIELSNDKISLIRLTVSILISKNNNVEWFRSNEEIVKIVNKYKNDECEDIRNTIPLIIPSIPQLISTNSAYLPTPKSNESISSLISPSDIISPPATTPSSAFQVDPSFEGIINQMKEKLNSLSIIIDKDWSEKLNRSLYYNLYPLIPEAPRPKVMFLFENSIKIMDVKICDSVVNGIIGGLSRYISIELTKEILMKFLQLLNEMLVQLNS